MHHALRRRDLRRRRHRVRARPGVGGPRGRCACGRRRSSLSGLDRPCGRRGLAATQRGKLPSHAADRPGSSTGTWSPTSASLLDGRDDPRSGRRRAATDALRPSDIAVLVTSGAHARCGPERPATPGRAGRRRRGGERPVVLGRRPGPAAAVGHGATRPTSVGCGPTRCPGSSRGSPAGWRPPTDEDLAPPAGATGGLGGPPRPTDRWPRCSPHIWAGRRASWPGCSAGSTATATSPISTTSPSCCTTMRPRGCPASPGLLALLDHPPESEGDLEIDGDVVARRIESEAEAVQIMTIWKAKGLQFPVVCLPMLWRPGKNPDDVVVHGSGDRVAGRWTWPRGRTGPTPPRRSARKKRARTEEASEQLRLLYVALTRAQHHTAVWWANSSRADTGAQPVPVRPRPRRRGDRSRTVFAHRVVHDPARGRRRRRRSAHWPGVGRDDHGDGRIRTRRAAPGGPPDRAGRGRRDRSGVSRLRRRPRPLRAPLVVLGDHGRPPRTSDRATPTTPTGADARRGDEAADAGRRGGPGGRRTGRRAPPGGADAGTLARCGPAPSSARSSTRCSSGSTSRRATSTGALEVAAVGRGRSAGSGPPVRTLGRPGTRRAGAPGGRPARRRPRLRSAPCSATPRLGRPRPPGPAGRARIRHAGRAAGAARASGTSAALVARHLPRATRSAPWAAALADGVHRRPARRLPHRVHRPGGPGARRRRSRPGSSWRTTRPTG